MIDSPAEAPPLDEPKSDSGLPLPARAALYGRGPLPSLVLSALALVVAAMALRSAAIARQEAESGSGKVLTTAAQLDSLRWTVNAWLAFDTLPRDTLLLQYRVDQEIARWAPTLDLHQGTFQQAGGDFVAGHLSVTAIAGGSRVSGILVNKSSIGHTDARFTFSSRGFQREFAIGELPSGGAARFAVDVPGLTADSALIGTIVFLTSSMTYRRP